jgi:hypothetical protein
MVSNTVRYTTTVTTSTRAPEALERVTETTAALGLVGAVGVSVLLNSRVAVEAEERGIHSAGSGTIARFGVGVSYRF